MDSLVALGVATLILVAIPGPNVALIVANSVSHGFRTGAVTVLGTTFGIALQLSVVMLGMAALLELLADALTWIRWVGVAYLFVLGVRIWRQPPQDLRQVAAVPAVFWRASLVAAVNPKTLLFNAAFLPQFIATAGNMPAQLALVTTVYLSVLLLGDLLWAALAGSAQSLLAKRSMLRNKITGGALLLASIGLALSRRS